MSKQNTRKKVSIRNKAGLLILAPHNLKKFQDFNEMRRAGRAKLVSVESKSRAKKACMLDKRFFLVEKTYEQAKVPNNGKTVHGSSEFLFRFYCAYDPSEFASIREAKRAWWEVQQRVIKSVRKSRNRNRNREFFWNMYRR